MPIDPEPMTLNNGYLPSRSGAAGPKVPSGWLLGGDSTSVLAFLFRMNA
jgi:hypothetical protein